jgi:hypothetical protein
MGPPPATWLSVSTHLPGIFTSSSQCQDTSAVNHHLICLLLLLHFSVNHSVLYEEPHIVKTVTV